LETGSDIIFFWVARMVMMGLKLTNQLPFKMNEPINQSILPSLANHVQKMEKFLMKTMCLIHLHLKMKKKQH
jgi:valyl-tRNA synthetase